MLQVSLRVSDSSNVGITGLTATNIKFRNSPYGSGNLITLGGSGISGSVNGIYLCDFIGVAYQAAQVWIDGVYQPWGTKYVGDEKLYFVALTGAQTIADVKTFSSSPIVPAATSTGQAMRWDETIRTTGNQTGIAGTKVVTDLWAYSPSDITITGDGTFTSRKFVVDSIASAIATEFQESENHVRLFPDGIEVTGQVYLTPATAAASFASPSATNTCQVEIVGMSAGQEIINIPSTAFIDYVNWKGAGRHIYFSIQPTSINKTVRLENMTVVIGTYGATIGARTLQNFEFLNCTIIHYTGVTLNGCNAQDCTFLGSSTNAVTLDNVCQILNCRFNNTVVESGTGTRLYTDNFTYAPPTDPTTP